MANSPDNPDYLCHFTGRPRVDDPVPQWLPRTPEGRLAQILKLGELHGAKPKWVEDTVVCFSELSRVAVNTLLSKGFTIRGPYAPWGVVLRKSHLTEEGARPVWYMSSAEIEATASLPAHMRLRRVKYDESAGVDWTHEREWRLSFAGPAPDSWDRWNQEEGILPLNREMMIGVLVGVRGWMPPEIHPDLAGVQRYLWDGEKVVPDGLLGEPPYRPHWITTSRWSAVAEADWPTALIDPDEHRAGDYREE